MNRYSFEVSWSEADTSYVALCPEFPGLSALGESAAEAVSEMLVALEMAIETYREEGWELPEPRTKPAHSGQIRVRLPKELHAKLAGRAANDGVSLNTLIVAYLAESLGKHDVIRGINGTLERMVDQWQALLRTRKASPATRDWADAGEWKIQDRVFKHAVSTFGSLARSKRNQPSSTRDGSTQSEAPPGVENRVAKYVSEEWLDAVEKVATRSEHAT